MMSYARHFQRPVNVVRSFGLKRGATAYGRYVLDHLSQSGRWQSKQIAVNGASHPVWLRPGTSDWLVMEETFIARAYDYSTWPDHEKLVQSCYESYLAQSLKPVIVDCGANIGLSSIWFAEKFPHAEIYAVEPEPENYRILVQNASSYPNITPVKAAISDRETRVSLENSGDDPWAWKTKEAPDGELDAIAIPTLLERAPASRLLIVKVNIEGAEAQLFRSNLGWTEDTPLIIVELHDWLLPWRGVGHVVFSALTQHTRDYLPRGNFIFSFSHGCRSRQSSCTLQ